MKTRILWTIIAALAVMIVTSGSGTAFADGGKAKGKGPRPNPPEVIERVLRSEMLLDDAGKQVGTVEIVAHESSTKTKATSSLFAATAVTTSQRTCWVEFKVTVAGVKVVSYKLYTKFNYLGGGLTYVYPPWVSASTSGGWTGGNYQKGWYWIRTWWSAESWATGDFALKFGGVTFKTYHPTIGIDFYGSGSCYSWGYW